MNRIAATTPLPGDQTVQSHPHYWFSKRGQEGQAKGYCLVDGSCHNLCGEGLKRRRRFQEMSFPMNAWIN
ncbi:MAG: hypothetical protein QM654_15550 [Dysgonamonadaceae bacterium]